MNSDVRYEKKKEERAPGIKDFLWEYMIKKSSPPISSGVLVGRNSTLLTQIDYTQNPPEQHTPHTLGWWRPLKKQRGRKYGTTKKGFWEISAISVHNQPVEVVWGGSLWLGWAQQVAMFFSYYGEGLTCPTMPLIGLGFGIMAELRAFHTRSDTPHVDMRSAHFPDIIYL